MKSSADIKILLVEDDAFFLRVLQKRTSSEGYQVMTAGDGREGMKAIVTFEPDLVVSDWMMPEVDGLELCQSVKTGLRDAAPYFILLTAKGEVNDKLLGLRTGADDYLTKPCDHGELMARIRAGVRIVSLTQDLRRAVAELQVANTALEITQAAGTRALDGITVCDGCHRVSAAGRAWQHVTEFLASVAPVSPIRGACPECADRTAAKPGASAAEAA